MTEWPKKKLREIFRIENGFAFKSAEFIDDGVRVIKIKNIKAGHFSQHEFSYVHNRFLGERPKKVAQIGDLLISMSGNRHDGSPDTWVGKIAFFDAELPHLINQRVGALRPLPEVDIDRRYFAYVLAGLEYQNLFIAIATSSGGQANLSPNQILSAEIVVPPLREQRQISLVLSALDDKIELNRRMNETLEAQARALFRDWFVDFGPVKAKAKAKASDPDAPTPYLAPDLWSLFPDRLGDDGVPEGWLPATLNDFATCQTRKAEPHDVDDATPYIGLEHMPRRSISLTEWESAAKVTSAKSRFRKREILFGKLRPYFHKVGIAPLDGICSTDIVVLAPKKEQLEAFVLACVSTDAFVAFTDKASTGTKMPRTSWKVMKTYPMVKASKAVFEQFQLTCGPMLDQILANIDESRTLAQTRDLLLQKLMSGEIRVGEAEKNLNKVL